MRACQKSQDHHLDGQALGHFCDNNFSIFLAFKPQFDKMLTWEKDLINCHGDKLSVIALIYQALLLKICITRNSFQFSISPIRILHSRSCNNNLKQWETGFGGFYAITEPGNS